MSHLDEFHIFLRQRDVALDDIDEFAELIKPVTIDGDQGYRLKAIKSPDKILQRCQALLFYTWHCRDYVKKLLMDDGPRHSKDVAGQVINECVKNSIPAQVVSYLANAYKHCGVDLSQKWAIDIAPRLGKPYVIGQQMSFPHQLKPTVIITGEKLADFEFSGQASVGDEIHTFNDFEWKHSCEIENKDGKVIGDVLSFCETTFGHWMHILREAGFIVFPYLLPVSEGNSPWSFQCDGVNCLCLFTSEEAIRRSQAKSRKPGGSVLNETRCILFKTANALAKMLDTNRSVLEGLGFHKLVIDPAPNSKVRVAEIDTFVRFLKAVDASTVQNP